MTDIYTYKTILKKSEGIYKEKGSKFIGYAFPVSNIIKVKKCIEELRKEHSSARHFCYAYRIGVGNNEEYRFNDDGEPSSSAGKPIYGQILSTEITNVLIVVVRYFGGTKLGVGGLITAYKEGAKEALLSNQIVEKEITKELTIKFGYDNMSEVMIVVNRNSLEFTEQDFSATCSITFNVTLKDYKDIVSQFEQLRDVVIV